MIGIGASCEGCKRFFLLLACQQQLRFDEHVCPPADTNTHIGVLCYRNEQISKRMMARVGGEGDLGVLVRGACRARSRRVKHLNRQTDRQADRQTDKQTTSNSTTEIQVPLPEKQGLWGGGRLG